MSIRIDVDMRGINRAIQNIRSFETQKLQKVKDVINESSLNVMTGAKRRCVVNTGRLRASITIEPYNGGLLVQVGTRVAYAAAVEFGTGPHVIRPKNKKALFWPGARHPVKLVRHPGTRARPFLFPSWEEERPKFIRAIREALRA
jgi:HK97 gp10 family phage protein